MKTLRQIQDEYAVKYGFKNIKHVCDSAQESYMMRIFTDSAKEYARLSCEEQKQLCVKNSDFIGDCDNEKCTINVDYNSIKNAPIPDFN